MCLGDPRMKGTTRSVVNFQLPLGIETKNNLPFSSPFISVGHTCNHRSRGEHGWPVRKIKETIDQVDEVTSLERNFWVCYMLFRFWHEDCLPCHECWLALLLLLNCSALYAAWWAHSRALDLRTWPWRFINYWRLCSSEACPWVDTCCYRIFLCAR